MSSTINQATEKYYKIREELGIERRRLTRRIVEIDAKYEEVLSDLCSELVEQLALFELFPYFPESIQEDFIRTCGVYYRIPNTDNIYIYINVDVTGLYIELSGSEYALETIFSESLRDLSNNIEKLKEASDTVKTYIN